MLFLKAKPLPYWLVLTLLGIKFVITGPATPYIKVAIEELFIKIMVPC
jgi:hypothetical protein